MSVARHPARQAGRRLLVIAAACVAGVLIGGLAVAVYVSERAAGSRATATTACAPRPCADLEGYTVWVGDVRATSGLVTMQVAFRNASPATHAEPLDFSLVDAQGSHAPAFDAPGCARWARTEFRGGARLGPLPLCFHTARTTSSLRLHWTPDLGLFCCDTDITLTVH